MLHLQLAYKSKSSNILTHIHMSLHVSFVCSVMSRDRFMTNHCLHVPRLSPVLQIHPIAERVVLSGDLTLYSILIAIA